MRVYRICSYQYSQDLSGEGSRLYGGRWNNKGVACIYTSENRALSLCEFSCHAHLNNIPDKLALITYEASETNGIGLQLTELPKNWREDPSPDILKTIGTELLRTNNYYYLKVPSTVIPHEFNFIFNPHHKDFNSFSIISIEEFIFDQRLKQ